MLLWELEILDLVKIWLPVSTPVNTGLPVITGNHSVGGALVCSTGLWLGTPTSFLYAWYVNGIPRAGLPSATSGMIIRDTDVGHVLTCRVTAINSAGEHTVTASNSVTP